MHAPQKVLRSRQNHLHSLRISAQAKRVVQVFCAGGVSHLETFDYKPELERVDGQTLEGKGENLGFFGQPES